MNVGEEKLRRKMIDVLLWRARIGCFNGKIRGGKVGQRERSGAKQENGESLTGWSVLAAVLCLCAGCALLNGLWMFALSVWALEIPATDCFLNLSSSTVVSVADMFDSSQPEFGYLGQSESLLLVPQVLVLGCATNAVFSVMKLLLSNDISLNPGPVSPRKNDEELVNSNKKDQEMSENNSNMGADIAEILSTLRRQEEQAQKDREERNEQNRLIHQELSEIKTELSDVAEKCHQINDRCTLLESEQSKLTSTVDGVSADVDQLHDEVIQGKNETQKVTSTITNLQHQVTQMNEEIDRLEGFSRRDNLRFFGIPHGQKEDYETCAKCVVDTLNSVAGYEAWKEEDIIRAHRIGQARSGEPKPMIVKFRLWQHKMKLLRDRDFRSELERKGIRLANDLTKKQAEISSKAREMGKIAVFVRGKMQITDRRETTRSYAEVTKEGRPTDTDSRLRGTHKDTFGITPQRNEVNQSSQSGTRFTDTPSAAEKYHEATTTREGQHEVIAGDSQSGSPLADDRKECDLSPSSQVFHPVREKNNSSKHYDSPQDSTSVSHRVNSNPKSGKEAQNVCGDVNSDSTPKTVSKGKGGGMGAKERGDSRSGMRVGGGQGNSRQSGINSYLSKAGNDRSLRSNRPNSSSR